MFTFLVLTHTHATATANPATAKVDSIIMDAKSKNMREKLSHQVNKVDYTFFLCILRTSFQNKTHFPSLISRSDGNFRHQSCKMQKMGKGTMEYSIEQIHTIELLPEFGHQDMH